MWFGLVFCFVVFGWFGFCCVSFVSFLLGFWLFFFCSKAEMINEKGKENNHQQICVQLNLNENLMLISKEFITVAGINKIRIKP